MAIRAAGLERRTATIFDRRVSNPRRRQPPQPAKAVEATNVTDVTNPTKAARRALAGRVVRVPFRAVAAGVRVPLVIVRPDGRLRTRVEDHRTEITQGLIAAAAAIFTLGLLLVPFAGRGEEPAPVLSPPTTAPPTSVAEVQTAPGADVVAPVEPAIEGDLPAD